MLLCAKYSYGTMLIGDFITFDLDQVWQLLQTKKASNWRMYQKSGCNIKTSFERRLQNIFASIKNSNNFMKGKLDFKSNKTEVWINDE